jgi:hypothetical protein
MRMETVLIAEKGKIRKIMNNLPQLDEATGR